MSAAAAAAEEPLEADWVSVRPHVFEEKHKSKFVFIAAWNEEEGKFALTCHNRTAQRQRSCSRGSPLRGAQAGEPEPPGGAGGGPPLDPEEECSWAGLYSSQDLRAVHQQLCSVNAELEPCLPAFPAEPAGVWAVLFGGPEAPAPPMEGLCVQLQLYLGHALDTCGWKILSRILFSESGDPEEYYESLSELRRKGYEEVLQRARRGLQQLLEKHKNTESMVELLDLYQREDEAYSNLAEATTELYQYLLQPFRDMRELAMLRRQQIKISLENDYLGPRRIESLKKEDADWQRKAHMAVLSIQDLTVKYFEITAKAQKDIRETQPFPRKRTRQFNVRIEISNPAWYPFHSWRPRSLGGKHCLCIPLVYKCNKSHFHLHAQRLLVDYSSSWLDITYTYPEGMAAVFLHHWKETTG